MRRPYGKILAPKEVSRIRRKLAIRKKVNGSKDRPRVCVVTSNRHISVQVIDDGAGRTLFAVQTFGKKAVGSSSDAKSAVMIGKQVAEGLKQKGITAAVFDRNGRFFGGTLSVLASEIRANGIQI